VPNTLRTLCTKMPNINRIIVSLFTLQQGYTLMLYIDGESIESSEYSYENYDVLNCIDHNQIPVSLLELIGEVKDFLMYNGCIICEVRDYSIAANEDSYKTEYKLLKPTQETQSYEIKEYLEEFKEEHQWDYDECQQFESDYIFGTAEPLCLDPSPAVTVIKNNLQRRKNPLHTRAVKRHIRRLGPKAALMKIGTKSFKKTKIHKLESFMRNMLKQPDSTLQDIRLPSKKMDLWGGRVDLKMPSLSIDVRNLLKIPEHIKTDLITGNRDVPQQVKLQDIVFRSEGGQSGREAKSKITVYQDPSTHEYMGKLLSNKQVRTQVTAGENPQVGGKIQSVNQCSQLFKLGNKRGAEMYINQFQELFSEDGRRNVTVSNSAEMISNAVMELEEKPLQQQSWQMEPQYDIKVHSVCDIDEKNWQQIKLRENMKEDKKPTQQQLYIQQQQVKQMKMTQQQMQQQQRQQMTQQQLKMNEQAHMAAKFAVEAAANSAHDQQTASKNMAKRLQQQKQYQLQQHQQKQLQLKQQQLQRLQKNQLKRRFAASSQSQQQQGVNQESHNLIEQAFQTANEQSEPSVQQQQSRIQVQGQVQQGQQRVVRVMRNGQVRKLQVVTSHGGQQKLLGNQQQQVVLNNRKAVQRRISQQQLNERNNSIDNTSGQLIGVQTQETEEQKSSTPLLANINQSIQLNVGQQQLTQQQILANRSKERQLLANRKSGMVNISHQTVGRQISSNQISEQKPSNVEFVSESKPHVQTYTLQNCASENSTLTVQNNNNGGNNSRAGTSGQIFMTADGQQVILPRQLSNIQSNQRFKTNNQSGLRNAQSTQQVQIVRQPVRVDDPQMQRLINERLSQAANQQQRQRVIIRQQEHNNQISLAQRLQRTNQTSMSAMTLQQQQERLKKLKQNIE